MQFYLLGIKHSGKSSVGRELAGILQLPFYDLDHLIEDNIGCSVREFYRENGQEMFQQEEFKALKSLKSSGKSFICATGGGICDNKSARSLLSSGVSELLSSIASVETSDLMSSNSVYIDVEFDTVYERILRGGIPPFLKSDNPKEEFREMYKRRDGLYRTMASSIVSGNNKTPKEIAQDIIESNKENIDAR